MPTDTASLSAESGPADFVDHLDLPFLDRASDDWQVHTLSTLALLRERSWLARSELGIEVLTHRENEAMNRDRRIAPDLLAFFAGLGIEGHVLRFVNDGLLPGFHGERHERVRKVLMRAFTVRRIDQERATMSAVANALLDEAVDANVFDVVADFSHRYPVEVICRLLGVPVEDIPQFERWTLSIGHLGDSPLGSGFRAAEEGAAGLAAYFAALVDERTKSPQDDFISTLIEVQAAGDRLTHDEMIYNLVNLLMAGHETTRFQFASLVSLLLQHRGQWVDLVGDPALAPGAVDEALRMRPAVRVLIRTPTEPVRYRDVVFPSGARIVTNMFAANHDPEVFPSPHAFDIRRPNASRHLTFGLGAHLCLGQALARAEMTEALSTLVRRAPQLRLAADPVEGDLAAMTGGVEQLLVTAS